MTVLIPAYEPTEKLLILINELKNKTAYKIVIIDDGSGENYQDIFKSAEKLDCVVLSHKKNKGKGAALKTGFMYLRKCYYDENVVCADSDGQHCVEDIIKISENINKENEMILGVRLFDNKVPFKSRSGNIISAALFKLISGIALNDTQTGLRGYPFSMLEWLINQNGTRFEYELNLLIEAKNANISIKQIIIKTIYENNNKGTHFRPFIDSVRIITPLFKSFIKFSASSFTAGILDFILLFAFLNLTGNLFFSVVLARVISSVYNYTVNRLFVFKAVNISKKQSVAKYFTLAGIIMILNYFSLLFFINFINMPEVASKIITEIILFLLSYTVQKLFVFKKAKIL